MKLSSSATKGGKSNHLSFVENLSAKLEAMRTSSVVSLNDYCIGDEGCQVLAAFLQKYTTVTDLELRGNNISGIGISALANAIRQNYTLKTISLEWNNLGSSENGLQNLFNALAENRSIVKLDVNNNEIGPEVGNYIANCLKSNQTLQILDLRWNRIGNTGVKQILKGLNLNKSLQMLELAGNKVSDDYLRTVNDLLNRNKNGEFHLHSIRGGSETFSRAPVQPTFVNEFRRGASPSKIRDPSPLKKPLVEVNFDDEDNMIEQRQVNLVNELELETKKRLDLEDAYERLKEEFLKKDLEDARHSSELQARIDQLEGEKQNLQLKIIRISDQFEKGDVNNKEKQITYEEMLQESKRAYIQLDDTYKQMIERIQNEKTNALKQQEKIYQAKIKNLEDNLKQIKELNDDQKRQIDLLQAQKIDQQLDFDNKLYTLEKNYQQEQAKSEEQRLRHLEATIDKLSKQREDLNSRMKQESKQMIEKFKTLNELLQKNEERTGTVTDKIVLLEKENAQLKATVNKLNSEVQVKDQQIDKLEGQKKEGDRIISSSKDIEKQQIDKLSNDLYRERRDHEKQVTELNLKISDLESQVGKLNSEINSLYQIKDSIKEQIKSAFTSTLHNTFQNIN